MWENKLKQRLEEVWTVGKHSNTTIYYSKGFLTNNV